MSTINKQPKADPKAVQARRREAVTKTDKAMAILRAALRRYQLVR